MHGGVNQVKMVPKPQVEIHVQLVDYSQIEPSVDGSATGGVPIPGEAGH